MNNYGFDPKVHITSILIIPRPPNGLLIISSMSTSMFWQENKHHGKCNPSFLQ